MSTVIRAEGLSKMYHIGKRKSGNFREAISERVDHLFSKTKQDITEFWALKDVSFELMQGEVLGIIGKNGSGKSTLLKILSRITEPTEGRIEIDGRVAALLEVGTGFHPELTGRENIFMNGAILGMKRAEITKKFDEIVSFSGIEQFIDTPVKRYSSGMYVRLAFAVAANLEPEILIVDEVLAVGDAEFQKKCLGKMKDVSEHDGRTVIFVSHNMEAIHSLCKTAIWLKNGSVRMKDEVNFVVKDYINETIDLQLRSEFNTQGDSPKITFVELDKDSLLKGQLCLRIGFNSPYGMHTPVPGFVLYNEMGTPIYGSNTRIHTMNDNINNEWKAGVLVATMNEMNLYSGQYLISVWLGDMSSDYDKKEHAIRFYFNSGKKYTKLPPPIIIGSIDPHVTWKIEI